MGIESIAFLTDDELEQLDLASEMRDSMIKKIEDEVVLTPLESIRKGSEPAIIKIYSHHVPAQSY